MKVITREFGKGLSKGCNYCSLLSTPISNMLLLSHAQCVAEGCSIKQVFVLDLIKVFVLDLNFLAKINKDFN